MVQHSRYLLSLDPQRSTLNLWAMAHVKYRLTRSQDQIKIIWWHCRFTSDLAMLLHCFRFWTQVGLCPYRAARTCACRCRCVCVCVHWYSIESIKWIYQRSVHLNLIPSTHTQRNTVWGPTGAKTVKVSRPTQWHLRNATLCSRRLWRQVKVMDSCDSWRIFLET